MEEVAEDFVNSGLDSHSLRFIKVVPHHRDAKNRPLPKERIFISEVNEAGFEDVHSETGDLSILVITTADGEDEGAHRSVFGNVRKGKLVGRGRVKDGDEVGVRSLVDRSRGGVSLFQEILLAILVNGENSSPDIDEDRLEFDGGSLQESKDVGEDTDRESDVDCPRTEIEEFTEEDESFESMSLREEDLEDDRKLFWMPSFRDRSLFKPDLESGKLFGEESRVDVGRRRWGRERRWRLIGHCWWLWRKRVEPPLFVFEKSGELGETHVDCEIPTIPKRVIVGLRKSRDGDRGAFVEAHDSFGE